MTDLILSLLPLVLGIVVSPLAIMALVVILLTHDAPSNGPSFLAGWLAAIVVVTIGGFLIFTAVEVHERSIPPLWVPLVRLTLSVLLLATAVWVLRRGRVHTMAMAHAHTPAEVTAAAPQLPGWLRSAETFTALRSFLLGFGIFVLNPVNASCAFLAALDIRLADVGSSARAWTMVVFILVAALPIAIPVVSALVSGERAEPFLAKTRRWIATRTSVLNAALLLVIAVLQAQRAIATLLWY